jgi:hypothetical protein
MKRWTISEFRKRIAAEGNIAFLKYYRIKHIELLKTCLLFP